MQPALLILLLILFIWPPCVAATPKPAGGERLLLIHSVAGSAIQEKELVAQAALYDSMVEYLADRGYRIVDRASAEQASTQIAVTHEIDPALNRAAALGLKFLAEYTIHFKTSTIIKDPEKGIGALVRGSAKIVDNTGARVITAKSAEASSTGHTPEDAITKASGSTGKRLASLLAKAMERHVSQNGNEGRTITMVIEGRETSIAKIFSNLEKSPHVAAIREVESGGGKATFEIISKTRREQIERDLLKSLTQQGISLNKIRSEGNRSTWKIR